MRQTDGQEKTLAGVIVEKMTFSHRETLDPFLSKLQPMSLPDSDGFQLWVHSAIVLMSHSMRMNIDTPLA